MVTSNEQRLRYRDLILTSKPCRWLHYPLFANAILDRNAPCVHEATLRPPASTNESRHVRYLDRGRFPPSALACTAGTQVDPQGVVPTQVTCAAARYSRHESFEQASPGGAHRTQAQPLTLSRSLVADRLRRTA